MATPESKIKGMLDVMFKREGVWYFSPQAGPYGVAGIPDRIAIVCGLFVGVEVKANARCKMTALQKRRKKEIEEAGGHHFLVYDRETIEQVRRFISHVRSRGSRQEGASCSIGGPGSYTVVYPDGTVGQNQLSFNSPPSRRVHDLTEPRVPSPVSNPVLLQLAGPPETNGPPKGHGSLPNQSQEVYSSERDGDRQDTSSTVGIRLSYGLETSEACACDLPALYDGDGVG